MGQQTALYQKHIKAGAKIVNFAGWDMPINYGSQIKEHNQVRSAAGVFDVSHMTVIDVSGEEAEKYLRYLLANDVAKLKETGHALYSTMLNHEGNVLDDLIVYHMTFGYRLVTNCATRTKVMRWMIHHTSGFGVSVEERPRLAILAVHGPQSIDKVCEILSDEYTQRIRKLSNFKGIELENWFVARTGYTGEKGLEFIFPASEASEFWDSLLEADIKPIGLAARDTLRLEAGMNLYGQDMDESTSPLAANLEKTIAYQPTDREFIGKPALIAHKLLRDEGKLPQLVGLVLEGRGVLREGQKVVTDKGNGFITSGSFSPTLKQSIALARIPINSESCKVDLRGTLTSVRIVKPNFVRFGKKVFE